MSLCADLGLFDDTCRHGMAGLYGSSDFSLYEEALLASTVAESVSVPKALSDRSPFQYPSQHLLSFVFFTTVILPG